MTPDDRRDLINAFILYNQLEDQRERASLFWAWEKVADLCSQQPFLALEILNQLVHATKDAKVLTMVACGPVEDLLNLHGELIIEDLAKMVQKGSYLRHSIFEIWPYVRSEAVQRRLQELDQIQFDENDDS